MRQILNIIFLGLIFSCIVFSANGGNSLSASPHIQFLPPDSLLSNLVIENNTSGQIEGFYEQCEITSGQISLFINNTDAEDKTVYVQFGGSATFGDDYFTLMPDSIVVTPGENTFNYNIFITPDFNSESLETIEIRLSESRSFDQFFVSGSSFILDHPDVQFDAGDFTACSGTDFLLKASGALSFTWDSPYINPKTGEEVVFFGPAGSHPILLTGNMNNCAVDIEFILQVFDVVTEVNTPTTKICKGSTVELNATFSPMGGEATWEPVSLFPNQNATNQTLALDSSQTIIVTYTWKECTVSDTLNLYVADNVEFTPAFDSISVCKGELVVFGTFADTAQYVFVPNKDIITTDTLRPHVIANESQEYTMTVISKDDPSCTKSFTFKINVIDINLSLTTPDVVNLCLGDSTIISYTTNPPGQSVIWEPADGNIKVLGPNRIQVNPNVSTKYSGYIKVGGCKKLIQVQVNVDSLPDLTLSWLPKKSIYCKGEYINFFSPNFIEENYPNITFNWNNALGAITDLTNPNLTVSTQDTFLYIRTTVNGACTVRDSAKINVVDIFPQFSFTDTTVCPNTPVLLKVTNADQLGEITWTPETGLSCTECAQTIATLSSSATITATATVEGCPVSASVRITVEQKSIRFNYQDTLVCPGEPVLTTITTPNITDIDWNPNQSCDNCVSNTLSTQESQVFAVNGKVDGCDAFGSVTINIIPTGSFPIDPVTTCPDFPVQVNVPAQVGNITWSPSNGLSCTNCNNPIVTVGQASSFTGTVVDSKGCKKEGILNVLMADPQAINLSIEPSSNAPIGTEVLITILNPVPGATYEWFVNGRSVGNQSSPYSAPVEGESNSYRVVMSNTATICGGEGNIGVNGIKPTIKMPNAFTPNNDDTNDLFKAVADAGVKITSFKIVSRWGQTVYSSEDNDGWDGKINGKDAPTDTYLYNISYKFATGGSEFSERGEVNLIR